MRVSVHQDQTGTVILKATSALAESGWAYLGEMLLPLEQNLEDVQADDDRR
jgi:hypothetical protein